MVRHTRKVSHTQLRPSMVGYTIESEEFGIEDPMQQKILILKSNKWCQFNRILMMTFFFLKCPGFGRLGATGGLPKNSFSREWRQGLGCHGKGENLLEILTALQDIKASRCTAAKILLIYINLFLVQPFMLPNSQIFFQVT